MEYVVFTIVLAASGVIITWAWKRFIADETSNGARSSRHLNGDVSADPIPPFKRTISGPRQDELEREEFENRLWSWQKKLYERRQNDPELAERLAGTKYTYVPRQSRSSMQSESRV